MGAEEVAAMTCPVKQASGQPDPTRKIAGTTGYMLPCSCKRQGRHKRGI